MVDSLFSVRICNIFSIAFSGFNASPEMLSVILIGVLLKKTKSIREGMWSHPLELEQSISNHVPKEK